MSDEVKGFWRIENPIAWGLGATIALAIIVCLVGIQTGPDGIPRFKEFASLPSNAVGDTLAGIFAPLAFIWIVVTVFLQSHELREQRIELGLTREELRLAREAQEKQLSVMQKQAEIFDDERTFRLHQSSKETLDQLIEAIAASVGLEKSKKDSFLFASTSAVDLGRISPFTGGKGDTSETMIMSLLASLEKFKSRVFPKDTGNGGLRKKSPHHSYYLSVCGDFDYILELMPRLAEDQQIRVQRLGIKGCRDILLELLNADIWDFESGQTA